MLFYIQAINNCNLKFENTALFTIALQKREIFLYKSYKIHRGSKNRTSQNTGRRSQRKYKEKDILCSCVCGKSLQSCPTLCDPIDYTLLGSPVHMVLQARVLVWVAIAFSELNKLGGLKQQNCSFSHFRSQKTKIEVSGRAALPWGSSKGDGFLASSGFQWLWAISVSPSLPSLPHSQ